ncbi:molecular chaperone HtpG [Tuwongella immobilis]|uniref:Chaperone protein HtpG n=1 Tax=Tuwongella immobilis TaxID=692036 RepID=A0A6C2YQM5_9BACT|nr:molecular chaperone HtpG [Tuwongella immobilis]VIP03657.1 heat shock protein 90 : Chaperone protein HtpG OS=Geobacter lovleyi (strain ATCC BAA-1151 / DSM 17278 / SZ) GN=htpG PE=3 SV=1: HATPase_c_3: HSP90 [Tuwongella immobilis]VTS04682.1 heat shock protein 90 : Chaperone protein HtpG OS=Geobacter lovleyi (strain ATCC BAA-1151 / DSM 17278 / SZ) GN=htpG PE=3 SV=1: HATPase_c_3: HSP90 [Tuwongella immobilis]
MTPTTEARETREFKTELKQLLHLITHSLYSNREIFLRELISNASDAINKIKFDSLSHEELLENNKDWKIKLIPNSDAKTLTISDNGLGMSRETVIQELGTIARSGTKAFLESLKQKQADGQPELIGQFGVGFYSAFMVADKVTVVTRPAGTSKEGVRWESDGQGEFTVESIEKDARGTDVILHLKDDATEFLDRHTLRSLVRKFSDFVEHSIVMDETTKAEDGTETTSEESLNSRKAIWLRNRNEVTADEYNAFYRQISDDTQDPARVIHVAAEGSQEFKALMFIPARKPYSYRWEEPKPGLKLYIQRVLIMDPCEAVLPPYLRFVRGVVDSSDLPLNVSREILQSNPILDGLQKNLTRNVLQGLEALRNLEYDKYVTFYNDLGGMLKEGIARDWNNKEKLADLLLFQSVKTPAGSYLTFKQYVEAMPENQSEIYYLVGDSREVLERSPYLESFKARGFDVLLLTDPVIDEYFLPNLPEYKGKKLKPVDRGDVHADGDQTVTDEEKSRFAAMLQRFQTLLPEVKEVRLTKRMTESAACLVADPSAMPAHLERLMQQMGQGDGTLSKRILELNPNHPAVLALVERWERATDDPRIEIYARLLYDQAVIAEGSKPKDPAGLAQRINELLARDARN